VTAVSGAAGLRTGWHKVGMDDLVFSPEFLLAAACCRWPPGETRNAAVRAAAARLTGWNGVLRLARRHRILGFVHDALAAAALDLPGDATLMLTAQAAKFARQNALLAREAARLQGLLDAAQIPVVVLKGLPLAQLAYGSCASKQTRDIDLLVPPDCAEAALQILEAEGYQLLPPAECLGSRQRRAVLEYAREVELRHRGSKIVVELQWRPTNNPLLLQGIDARAPTQSVALGDGSNVRTLADDDLFAQVCVHGAGHAWSRLKWLADLNALVSSEDTDIARLYRHAQSRGAGLCAGQALLLCELLFERKLPAAIAAELAANRRVKKLAAIALQAMTSPQVKPEGMVAVANNIMMQFLLGQGWVFFAAQCRIASVGVVDVIALPLPPRLRFLYPVLRLPLWVWRRVSAGRSR
jgi:hypothetical protein